MKCPFAQWQGPTSNQVSGGMKDHRGLVLHIAQSPDAQGTINWQKNPTAQVSSHFVNDVDGTLYQVVDTDDMAWAEMAGNGEWLSVENIGYSGNPLTNAQVQTLGKLFAWISQNFNVPLVATDDPNGSGLGWHGMGGDAWGGHLQCPGDPIKAQRPQILAVAIAIVNPQIPTTTPIPTSEDNMNQSNIPENTLGTVIVPRSITGNAIVTVAAFGDAIGTADVRSRDGSVKPLFGGSSTPGAFAILDNASSSAVIPPNSDVVWIKTTTIPVSVLIEPQP